MKSAHRPFNLKPIKSKGLLQKGGFLVITALLANHLVEIDSFPFSKSYTFPLFAIFTSLLIGSFILFIAELNFRYFENKFFKQEIRTKTLTAFLLSTFGYITLLYIPCYYMVVWLQDGDFGLYYLIVGLAITLLISALALVMLYAQKLYHLQQKETANATLVIPQGHKKIIVELSEIAYFYSEYKIVYLLLCNGQKIASDFTLNEVESKINTPLFLRANRQTLIHSRAIQEIKSIENGKLLVTLHPPISDKEAMQIVVSRYKKKAFNAWFKQHQEYPPTIQV